MGSISSPPDLPHIAIFPFMAKGHTIPLIHFAHIIHRRRLATLTFFTTRGNASFLRDRLAGTATSIVELPFPQDVVPEIPPGVESTDALPSPSLFIPFVNAVRQLQPCFEEALEALRTTVTVSFLISDGFLTWTNESASKFGLPRIVFYGLGNFAWTILSILGRSERTLLSGLDRDSSVAVPGFPRVRLTSHDLLRQVDDQNRDTPMSKFFKESIEATEASQGLIVNSFYGLDADYFDFWNDNFRPKAWCVGPVCQVQSIEQQRSGSIRDWLDSKLAANRPVLYVAFGTQAVVSEVQLQEIAAGLERSGLDFLWVVRAMGGVDLGDGFEERVAERGKVVRDWVEQMQILRHGCIKGFVSHCGWNSVLEAVVAGVPILAWPMMAEQHLNAKFVAEEVKVGLRVRASDGTRDGLVKREDVARLARELMAGERSKELAENVKELAAAAEAAVGTGGTSWRALEQMINEVAGYKKTAEQNSVP